MNQIIKDLVVDTTSKKINEVTNMIQTLITKSNIKNGLLNLSIMHTSCSLMVQENADNTVIKDIENYLSSIVPECETYSHSIEGPDDMPAHLKTLLTQTNLTLSVKENKLKLGTWQGIFLLEHRYIGRKRKILFHLIGE